MTNIITETVHNVEALLEGKASFSQVMADEGATIEAGIQKLPAVVQGSAELMYQSLKAGLSAVVGAGLTAAGPILSESTSEQAAQIENILSALGVNLGTPLTLAEHAMLVTVINGLKAGLDRAGLHITTTVGVQAALPAPAKAA